MSKTVHVSDDYPEKCEWEGPYGAERMGVYKKTLSGMTIEGCKQACEDESTFHCMSFDFYNGQYCYLSTESKYDRSTSVNAAYIYYERNCKSRCQTISKITYLSRL